MKYTFSTNINCGGCIEKIRPHLENATGINNWQVDVGHSKKLLTVNSTELSADEIIEIVSNAGFRASPYASGWKRLFS